MRTDRQWVEDAARDRHHGVISRSQALAAGMTPAQIDRRLRRGHWVAPGPRGWYLPAGLASQFTPRLALATLALDAPAWGPSAVILQGLEGYGPAPAWPMVATKRRYRGEGVRVVWVEGLADLPTTRRKGIKTVTLPIAIAATARWVGRRGLHALIDEAVRTGRCTWESVEEGLRIVARSGRGGSARMTAVRADRSVDAAVPLSDWSRDLAEVLGRAGFGRPRMEWRVEGPDGAMVAQVDLAYPVHRYAIELDSVAYHLNREAFEVDRRRDGDLARLGWRVRRFTWDQWSRHRSWVMAVVASDLGLPAP